MMPSAKKSQPTPDFKTAYETDPDLEQYGPNRLGIFALNLYLDVEEIHAFAVNAITEGGNDKKCDILDIDLNEHRATICQCYLAEDWNRAAADANKASDLNTAMTWLLSAAEARIPTGLRAKAKELRRAIADREITRLDMVYIHNCHESKNVQEELKTVAAGAQNMVRAILGANSSTVETTYKELGLESLEELYHARDSEIRIDGWIPVPAGKSIVEEGNGWNAILTSVPGYWLSTLHKEHGDDLYSANYRGYLGSSNRSGNINRGISETAHHDPGNFWVYNNGVTALTYEINRLFGRIRIRGISVINGAQTIGAMSGAEIQDANTPRVLIRFVECKDKELVHKIIEYNNTQNEIKPSDRRSNDDTQRRLQREFEAFGVRYVHRRSRERVPKTAMTAASIGPALAAFHGRPQVAYRNAADIFLIDDTYEQTFPRRTSAQHTFLVRALATAVDTVKVGLKTKSEDKMATPLEEDEHSVLKFSPSKHFILYLVGYCGEQIMNQGISDPYEWKCSSNLIAANNHSLQDAWVEVLEAMLPFVVKIVKPLGEEPFYDVPRSNDLSEKVARDLKALLASLGGILDARFAPIRERSTA